MAGGGPREGSEPSLSPPDTKFLLLKIFLLRQATTGDTKMQVAIICANSRSGRGRWECRFPQYDVGVPATSAPIRFWDERAARMSGLDHGAPRTSVGHYGRKGHAPRDVARTRRDHRVAHEPWIYPIDSALVVRPHKVALTIHRRERCGYSKILNRGTSCTFSKS